MTEDELLGGLSGLLRALNEKLIEAKQFGLNLNISTHGIVIDDKVSVVQLKIINVIHQEL